METNASATQQNNENEQFVHSTTVQSLLIVKQMKKHKRNLILLLVLQILVVYCFLWRHYKNDIIYIVSKQDVHEICTESRSYNIYQLLQTFGLLGKADEITSQLFFASFQFNNEKNYRQQIISNFKLPHADSEQSQEQLDQINRVLLNISAQDFEILSQASLNYFRNLDQSFTSLVKISKINNQDPLIQTESSKIQTNIRSVFNLIYETLQRHRLEQMSLTYYKEIFKLENKIKILIRSLIEQEQLEFNISNSQLSLANLDIQKEKYAFILNKKAKENEIINNEGDSFLFENGQALEALCQNLILEINYKLQQQQSLVIIFIFLIINLVAFYFIVKYMWK